LTNHEILKEQLLDAFPSSSQGLDLLDFTMLDNENSYLSSHDFNKMKSNKNFFLLHINICSLNKNLEKLEELMLELGKFPDIKAISETKLNSIFFNQLTGYNFE